jgi:hypothetical protein
MAAPLTNRVPELFTKSRLLFGNVIPVGLRNVAAPYTVKAPEISARPDTSKDVSLVLPAVRPLRVLLFVTRRLPVVLEIVLSVSRLDTPVTVTVLNVEEFAVTVFNDVAPVAFKDPVVSEVSEIFPGKVRDGIVVEPVTTRLVSVVVPDTPKVVRLELPEAVRDVTEVELRVDSPVTEMAATEALFATVNVCKVVPVFTNRESTVAVPLTSKVLDTVRDPRVDAPGKLMLVPPPPVPPEVRVPSTVTSPRRIVELFTSRVPLITVLPSESTVKLGRLRVSAPDVLPETL